jgi:23S rRNA (guanosine2251-2'-O)-methyltransferase
MVHVVAGRRAVAEAIRAGRATEVHVATAARSTQGLRSLLEAAHEAGVPTRRVERRELDALAAHHQGAVAFVVGRGARMSELSERDVAEWAFADDAIVVVLDGVTDPQNLGAAARSAEAAGAAMLVTRVRRAADVTPAAIGASAGALLHLPHARVANVARAVGRLRDAGFAIVGLDDAAPASIYDEPCPPGRVALVVGSEGSGMSRLVREACDVLCSIPMRGSVGSLNVAASLAAALYGYVVPSHRGRGAGPVRGGASGRPANTPG